MEKNSTTNIFGIHAVNEALASEKYIDKVFILKQSHNESLLQLERKIKHKGIAISYVPIEKLNKLSSNNHQGIVALISPITFWNLEDLVLHTEKKETPALFLILDGVSDARNFGAIIRTAECTGVSGIILPNKGSAPVNGDTIKTSAGAVFNIPICKVNHIKDALFYMQASNIKTIAATEKTHALLYNVNFVEPCAIIMGSEGNGVSPSVLKLVDEKAKLPLLGEISSLNVSVACGAFLYEVVRQRL